MGDDGPEERVPPTVKKWITDNGGPLRHGGVSPMKQLLLVIVVRLLAGPVWTGAAELQRPLGTKDVVALVGGTQLAEAAAAGYLEALVAVRSAHGAPRFRDFSWEGDTVFERPRPVNFPELTVLLTRSGATVALLQFGQMESLAGVRALPAFSEAYEALLKSVDAVVSQVVLVTPTPFAEGGVLEARTVETRNRHLAAYVAEIQRLGEAHDLPVVNVFRPLTRLAGDSGAPLRTVDGVRLTDRGQMTMAVLIGNQLSTLPSGAIHGAAFWAALEPVRQAAQAKHQLWTRYWRPTNWAFLAGDRTDQPSSRDHVDRNIRWFPAEMEEYGPLIQAADAEIARRAGVFREQEAAR